MPTNHPSNTSAAAGRQKAREDLDKRPGKCHLAHLPGSHAHCTATYHEQSKDEQRENELANERLKCATVFRGQMRAHDIGGGGDLVKWAQAVRAFEESVIDEGFAERQREIELAEAEANRPRTEAEQRVDAALAYWNGRLARDVSEQVMALRYRWVELVLAGASPAMTEHIEMELDLLGWGVPVWNPVRTADRAVAAARKVLEDQIAAGQERAVLDVLRTELAAAEAELAAARRRK